MIAVSAVSLLLVVTLATVILTQCLLIIRMRRSDAYTEPTNHTTSSATTDIPVSPNDAYAPTTTTEDVTYECIY